MIHSKGYTIRFNIRPLPAVPLVVRSHWQFDAVQPQTVSWRLASDPTGRLAPIKGHTAR